MALPHSDRTDRWSIPETALRRSLLPLISGLVLVPVLVALPPTQDGLLDGWRNWQGLRSPAFAHTVKVSRDVAATFHLEPNHNPRAGVPSLTWFVLTRRGGALIPFSQCNCQVAVYAVPRAKNARPLLRPALQALNVEGYQGVPGTQIVFPNAGQYEIVISGSPKSSANFQPFSINYSVVVSRGK